jgi:hypothetical protein
MFWYNPTTRTMERVPAPAFDAQAIEMLSGHPESDKYIEEYRDWRQTLDIAEALQLTGETFRALHRGEEPPPRRS